MPKEQPSFQSYRDIFKPDSEARGGTRGGQDKFNWDDIKDQRGRECYLGNSVKAPVGRWAQERDVQWWTKEKNTKNDIKVSSFGGELSEIELLKRKEAELMGLVVEDGFMSKKEMNEAFEAVETKIQKKSRKKKKDKKKDKKAEKDKDKRRVKDERKNENRESKK